MQKFDSLAVNYENLDATHRIEQNKIIELEADKAQKQITFDLLKDKLNQTEL